MIVSFDLDDTLYVDPNVSSTEKSLKFPFNRIYRERLRLGAVNLMNRIRKNGIGLWIYTTSFRSERYIRAYFRHYGIKLDEVINGQRHQREVQRDQAVPLPSKYPSRYRIDLHIDDDPTVKQNGKVFGFRVLLIEQNTENWDELVWHEIEKLKNQKAPDLASHP